MNASYKLPRSIAGGGDAGVMPGTFCGYFIQGWHPVVGHGYLDGGPHVSARQSVFIGPPCSEPHSWTQRELPSATCCSMSRAKCARTAGKKLRYGLPW